MPDLRPMTAADARTVVDLMHAAFAELDRRLGQEEPPPPDPQAGLVRVGHLIETDPGGCWVADGERGLAGAAIALLREGVWGLSLLVVDPDRQSQGLGRELLDRCLAHGDGGRAGIILASTDPRALRLYHRSGFALHPAVDVRGVPLRRPAAPERVRAARWPDDRDLVDAAGRHVRGAGHGIDIDALLAAGAELLVDDRGGFAVHRAGGLRLLAAEREDVAADLLRAVLHATPPDGRASVEFLTAGQDWALTVALEAGLVPAPGGAVFTRGNPGPLRPYVPSGAYL